MKDDRLPPETNRTERDLAGARAGHQESFAGLYERIAPAVLMWARLRIPPAAQSRIDPEDVVQEVWWRVLAGFDRRDHGTPFRPWVFKIASNVLLEFYRKGGKSFDEHREQPSEIADQVTSITSRLARSEKLRDLHEMIRSLDATDRNFIVHCGLEGSSPMDLAPTVSLSKAACVKRWQRLRTKLENSQGWRDLADN